MRKQAPAHLQYHSGGKATPVQTDDNNPLRNMGRRWGMDLSTRDAVKKRRAEGFEVAGPKDDALADRARRRNATEPLREAMRREDQSRRIEIR